MAKIFIHRVLRVMELFRDAWCFTGLAIACFLGVLLTAALHLVAWFPNATLYPVIYQGMSGGRPDQLVLGDGPFLHPEWVFFMWVAIYGYQLMLAGYVATLVCRSVRVTTLLVNVLHLTSLMTYFLALGALVTWNLLRGRQDTPVYFNCLTILGTCLTSIISHSVVVAGMSSRKSELLRECLSDLVSLRIFVVNALSALATWALVFTMQDVCQSLYLYDVISSSGVRYIWVVTVAVVVGMWLLIQVLSSKSALEYTVSPYIVTLLAYSSIIFDPQVLAQLDAPLKYSIYAIMFVMFLFIFIALAASVYKGREFEAAPAYIAELAMEQDAGDLETLPHHEKCTPEQVINTEWTADRE